MYDPTLKELLDCSPEDWTHFLQFCLGLPAGPFTTEKENLSTFVVDADRAFRFELPEPMVAHLEFESGWKDNRSGRFLKYNVLYGDKSGLPVATVVVLLCKDAMSSDMTGVLKRERPSAFWNGTSRSSRCGSCRRRFFCRAVWDCCCWHR